MSSQDPYSHPIPDHPSREPLEDEGERLEPPVSARDRRPWIRKPYPLVTFALVLVLLGLHIVQEAFGESASFWAIENLGQDRVMVWEGELWRLLTCSFFHFGWLHLVCNLLGIFLFGKVVERWLGPWRFLCCYLVFALMGSLTYQAVARGGIGIGASGALCGLIGVFLALRLGRKEEDHLVLGMRFFLWFFVICALLFWESFLWELSGLDIADSAHFGGLFSGVAAALYFFSSPGDPATGVTGRRGLIVFTAGALSLSMAIYGLAYPFMDWSWHLWRSDAALERGDEASAAAARARARSLGGDRAALNIIVRDASEGRLGQALRYWEGESLEDPELQAAAGFSIYDGVYFERGYCREIELLLDTLIELTDRALEEKGKSLVLLNQAAWFRALRGKDLDSALSFAQEARDLDCRNQAILNTLGWVHFQRSETKKAFEYLRYAVDDPRHLEKLCDDEGGGFDLLRALGLRSAGFLPNYAANYLYLALAYGQIGQLENARAMVRMVRQDDAERMLRLHEKRLLDELEETLGNSLPEPSGVFERRPSPFRR